MSDSALVLQCRRLASSPRTAIIDDRESVSFQELFRRASHAATQIRQHAGTGRIALLLEPRSGWVEALLACFLAGVPAVPLSTRAPERELSALLKDAGVTCIVCSGETEARARSLASDRALPLRALRIISGSATLGARPLLATGEATVALLIYTSGTTGKPKGAMLTHGNLQAQARGIGQAWELCADDLLLHALPLHHVHGICIALLNTLLNGGAVRLLPKFESAAVWEAMRSSTVWMAVPTMYQKLVDAYDLADAQTQRDWQQHARALRLCTSGSAALPVRLAQRWQEIAGDLPLERFGMTEIGVAVTNPLRGERRAGSVGRPLPITATRIVHDGKDAAEGEPGELWVRGESVFAGYHGREEATQGAFTDGWFRTGDTVSRDSDGYLRVLGRTSVDILKSAGYKVSALEIEEHFREHPKVAEVAVVGVPDAMWGDRVVAFVVPRSEASMDPEALRAWAAERMSSYKTPRTFLVVSELPRNSMGKVIKTELVALAMRDSPQMPKPPVAAGE